MILGDLWVNKIFEHCNYSLGGHTLESRFYWPAGCFQLHSGNHYYGHWYNKESVLQGFR